MHGNRTAAAVSCSDDGFGDVRWQCAVHGSRGDEHDAREMSAVCTLFVVPIVGALVCAYDIQKGPGRRARLDSLSIANVSEETAVSTLLRHYRGDGAWFASSSHF